MLLKETCCMESCQCMCAAETRTNEKCHGACAGRARRPVYVPGWMKAIIAVLAAALFFCGVFALLTAQAVWNADIQPGSVTVCGAEGEALTLPGLTFNGAPYVEADAWNAAFPELPGALPAPSYWGESAYYALTENGELKKG